MQSLIRRVPRRAVVLAIACSMAPAATLAAGLLEATPQLVEDSAFTKAVETPTMLGKLAAPVNQVCEPGAHWIRVGFRELTLDQYDALQLTSSGGDSVVLEGNHWNGRQFSTRALRGECVQIKAWFGSAKSRFQLDNYQYGTKALAETTVTVAGAGDICDSTDCKRTADLIRAINPVAVFTAGDNAYSNGTLSEYNGHYNTYWGPFKSFTHPTPGNHEYNTSGASGYFDYFNGTGVQTGIAGTRGKGYYSWDVGDWHFIALNSNISMSAGSAQETWLRSDLAANTKPCTAAVWHHPIVSRGNYTGSSSVQPLWNALYDAKADLVLVGHDHNYQRYGKANKSLAADPKGLRQILIGTGGRGFYALSGSHPLLERANANTYGVLKLTLSSTGYQADFVPVAGSTFTDTVSGQCNKVVVADFSVAAAPTSLSMMRGGTAATTVSVGATGGFTNPVTLSASGLPSGVTYAVATNPVTPGSSTSVSFSAAATASLGTFTITLTGQSGTTSKTASVQLTVSSTTPVTRIYSNGNLNSGTTAANGTAAPAGTSWSELQFNTGTSIANIERGYAVNANAFRLADDFTVPAGQTWTIKSIDTFAYKRDVAASPSPFTRGTLQIWRGRPGDSGSTVLCGDTSTNVLASTSDYAMFRIAHSVVPTASTPDQTRRIWRNRLNVPATCAADGYFTAGTYWLVWTSTDSASGSHFAPSIVVPGARTRSGANARQLTVSSNSWSTILDKGNPDSAPDVTQDLPFELNGFAQ
ncbi:metallophosphoesterase [Tahibacter amnicola]|uniref:Metallophosphoesterase n=1 Tax=Tahibacter amnicola TaxID=2976241 RepID=A0ABY6BKB9_9GAMM|nr:metallophosphoesterase [Tahibacter amnicola]UXI70459.1 metallophosphoesterase [Tahibacter amnicola]